MLPALLEPETAWGAVAPGILAAYLLGSVPFGWLMARGLRGVDLREVGSGNIGATNAMRVLGRPLGLLAFLLDLGKGFAPPTLLASGEPRLQVLLGAAAVCGHVWPVFLRFKGGKAVATGLGALTAIDPFLLVGGGLGWIVVLLATRYVGLASVTMGLLFPTLAWWRARGGRYGWEVVAGAGALALLIVVRHRSNMSRVIAGQEPRVRLFGRGGSAEGADGG